ncbi:hypothetical protein LINGRAHAP2_LOCUS32817 [Linum grandiflorum]
MSIKEAVENNNNNNNNMTEPFIRKNDHTYEEEGSSSEKKKNKNLWMVGFSSPTQDAIRKAVTVSSRIH